MGQVTYEEACEYILDIPKFAGKHTLADTKEMLGRLTGSRIESKIIHVAGTNGKGSVCAYLAVHPADRRLSCGNVHFPAS